MRRSFDVVEDRLGLGSSGSEQETSWETLISGLAPAEARGRQIGPRFSHLLIVVTRRLLPPPRLHSVCTSSGW